MDLNGTDGLEYASKFLVLCMLSVCAISAPALSLIIHMQDLVWFGLRSETIEGNILIGYFLTTYMALDLIYVHNFIIGILSHINSVQFWLQILS